MDTEKVLKFLIIGIPTAGMVAAFLQLITVALILGFLTVVPCLVAVCLPIQETGR